MRLSLGATMTRIPLSLPFCPSFHSLNTAFAYSSIAFTSQCRYRQHGNLVGGFFLMGFQAFRNGLARFFGKNLSIVRHTAGKKGNIAAKAEHANNNMAKIMKRTDCYFSCAPLLDNIGQFMRGSGSRRSFFQLFQSGLQRPRSLARFQINAHVRE